MSKIDESIGFYRKMSELQERLRRSEEQRLQLEEKFAVLMRSRHDEEEERLNNLRERYEAFLEEERQRRERNDRILQALDRIESRAAMLTAKSERLRLLRRHYEAYMLKIYPGWKYVTNKFTDGQPSSQKLDPLHNKLNLEADRTNPYGGLQRPPSLFPTDPSRTAARTLHRNYNNVGAVPANQQPVSASRRTIDTTSAARTVEELPSPSMALTTVNAADTQQEVLSRVITIGELSVPVAEKALPVYTQETLGSSQDSAAAQVECNKMRQLDDYLGRAADMLKLSRADDGQRVKNLSGPFTEINADSLKDTKHLGNSVDFELEQNTSGDLLNVSLSDDGVLQEETNRTLISPNQKGDDSRNLSQTQKVNVNVVDKKDEVLNKQAEFHKNVDNKDILLNKKFEDVHQESELAYAEQNNEGTVKCRLGNAENFETVLSTKDRREFDKQKHLYPQNSMSVVGGESVIPDNSIYCGEKVFQTEEENEVSHRKQQHPTLKDEAQNCDRELNGQRRSQGFERRVQDPLESEGDARRAHIGESSAEEVSNGDREMPVSESIYGGKGDQPDEGEEPGNTQLTEQKQWDENEQQYYQHYAGHQEDDQYYQYGEDAMYQHQYDQQHAEGYDQQHAEGYDQQYMMQEGEQYYQQYGEQVEGQYSQEYADQEGLQYNQQEGQYEQQLDQHDQHYADWQEGQGSQQYVEQQAGLYEQLYEEHQLEPGVQHISEDERTVQDEEYNKEKRKEHKDQVADELDQEQQHVFQRDQQDGVCDGSSYEDGKYQEPMEVYDAMHGSVGEGSQGIGSAGDEREKTLNEVVDGNTNGSTALLQQPGISSDLTEASPSENVRQYRQLSGETADPEQSDTDEMEMQLAALVESQQLSENPRKQLQQSGPLTIKMTDQAPVKVAPPTVENIGCSTRSTDGHKNVDSVAYTTDIGTSEVTGHQGNMHGNPEAQISSKPETESVALPKEGDPLKAPQPSVPRAGSKKLPGLTKMLESDTESLQLDATVSNEDSDDFDFSSDK